MEWSGEGIVCSVLRHGDSGAIVRLLTADAGIVSGYVRGGQSRRIKPALLAGNRVSAQWRARVDDQLGSVTVELVRSVAADVMTQPLAGAGIGWITALAAVAMPERQPYAQAHQAISAVIDSAAAATAGPAWAGGLAHAELVVLGELGFGLDLTCCAATGVTGDLAFVSPKSGQAVSKAAGEAWRHRLLPLPAFLITGDEAPDWGAVEAALRLSGLFIERHLLEGAASRIAPARARLLALLPRPEP